MMNYFRNIVKAHFKCLVLTVFAITCGTFITGISTVYGEDPVLHYYDKLLSAHMLDTGQAWAVGHDGKLIFSDNYGKNWVSQDPGTLRGLFSVFFITPEIGWISGERGLILHSRDGGRSWTVQGEGVADQPLLKIRFIDENIGWAMGSFGNVLKTKNGGETWTRSPFDQDMTFNDIYFFDENKGFAAAEFDNIMMTEDGGETWTALTEPDFGDIGNYFGIDFIDENRGVVVGTGGNIMYTLDGGAEWNPAQNNEERQSTLLKVQFFNEKQGVAIGLDGVMLFSRDGGLTWYPPSPITQFTWFSGISLLENGRGIVVGIGNIIITSDFGRNWSNPFGDIIR